METPELQQRQEFIDAARRAFRDGRQASEDDLVVTDSRTYRLQTTRTVAGPAAAVLWHVGRLLETDSCVPHYEHMLWQVGLVRQAGDTILVTLHRTLYAGD